MTYISKLIKWFKSLSLIRQIISISIIFGIGLYGIIIIYVLGIFVIFSSKITYTTLLGPLGFNFEGHFRIFYLWFILIAGGFVLNCVIRKKVNLYLWGALFISLAIIIFGMGFIGETYGKDLPGNHFWNGYGRDNSYLTGEGCDFSRLECKSVTNKLNYVEGDRVYCDFMINNSCSSYISEFNVKKSFLDLNRSSIPLDVSLTQKNHQAIFNFKVEKYIEGIWIHPIITNGSDFEHPFFIFLEFNEIYSGEEYRTMNQSKAISIITLISISLFSTFVAMNNLKQIMKKEGRGNGQKY